MWILPFIKWIQELFSEVLLPQIVIEHLLCANTKEIQGRSELWSHRACIIVTSSPVSPFFLPFLKVVNPNPFNLYNSLEVNFVSHLSPLVDNFVHHFTKKTENSSPVFSHPASPAEPSLTPFLPDSEDQAIILGLPQNYLGGHRLINMPKSATGICLQRWGYPVFCLIQECLHLLTYSKTLVCLQSSHCISLSRLDNLKEDGTHSYSGYRIASYNKSFVSC